jgi:acetyl-CoA/propionyl-CoA carboxylase carboxyl transferase subunit
MNSRSLGATKVYAWPEAEVAVMGAVAAVRILHKRKLAAVPADELHEAETALATEHAATVGGLDRAVEIGVIDEIISPASTAHTIAAAIAEAPQRRGVHKNIPL